MKELYHTLILPFSGVIAYTSDDSSTGPGERRNPPKAMITKPGGKQKTETDAGEYLADSH